MSRARFIAALSALIIVGCAFDRRPPPQGVDDAGSGDAGAVPTPDDADTTCVPKPEVCDGIDNDCDAEVDEGLVEACESTCGQGARTCVEGEWTACDAQMPSDELCDGLDNNCNGQRDEGLVETCDSACGPGSRSCVEGDWTDCDAPQPTEEVCDNADNDCDGLIDNGLSRPCSSECGAGTELCDAGQWVGCTARQPTPETCDGEDNDCDGAIDEGLPAAYHDVPLSELTLQHDQCTAPEVNAGFCMSASHRWCKRNSGGCHPAGAGLTRLDQSNAQVLCLPSDTTIVSATRSELEEVGWEVSDTVLGTPLANSIANSWCQGLGHAGGLGMLEYSPEIVFMACISNADLTIVAVDSDFYTDTGCNAFLTSTAPACNESSAARCLSRGYLGGIGPVTHEGGLAILCFSE